MTATTYWAVVIIGSQNLSKPPIKNNDKTDKVTYLSKTNPEFWNSINSSLNPKAAPKNVYQRSAVTQDVLQTGDMNDKESLFTR